MDIRHLLWTALLLGCACAAWPSQLKLYVAPNGNDAGPGTRERPFATIERARDEIRRIGPEKRADGVCVEIASGTYQLSGPLEFTAADSGAPGHPVEYRAREGGQVRLAGGRAVTGWKAVTDPTVLKRLDPAARGKVFQADLKALGITDLQGINNARVYQSDPGLELFFQDKPMTLARYPNTGYMKIGDVFDAKGAKTAQAATPDGKFVCDDPRIARWAQEKGIWLHGFWVWDWADERLPLGSVDPDAHTISIQPSPGRNYEARKGMWFYAENVFSELDSPGEWYLDRDAGILYFWPPSPLGGGKAVVSTVRDLIRLTDASGITFRGLTVEAGRGSAFTIKGGSQVRIVACTIRNMGNYAVLVSGGTEHSVIGCDIYAMGQGGITFDAGDRKTLTPAGHLADNNHIHHTARWDPVYQPAIFLWGVGNTATHNLIDNVPHVAIDFSGNDQTIEYNEIHSAVFQSNDAGAIYTSPPDETWTMRGHKIRYNYLHNIHGFEGRGCNGVYLDDCFSSADISGNIFYDVADAILLGGGRDNLMTNNLFLNCGQAFSIDARGLGWAAGIRDTLVNDLKSFDYQHPPWSTRYPELLNLLNEDPMAPKGTVVAHNVCWGGKWGWTEPKALPFVKFEDNLTDQDPLFAGKPPADFRLAPNSPARKIGFHAIPFSQIGVYKSPDRASWPVTSELRRDSQPPAPKPKPVRKAGPPPTFDIPRLKSAVTIDGQLTPDEWFGLDPAKGLILQEGVDGEKCAFRTLAWLAWDDDALYVAFDNAVDKDAGMAMGDAWGGSDAVELSLSNAALGAKAPIIVLRGFATGTFTSSDEAGAPPEVVRKAGEGVHYKAKVIDPGRWTAEMRVPFASLGIDPNAALRFPLNLAVRKQGDQPWVMWRGTGGCTWLVPEAGRVRFAR
jgi:parallel beta-helix repeat protein